MQQAIRNRVTRYRELGLTCQPYVLVVAPPGDNNIVASYVVLDENLWKCGSVLTSVEVCFKSFFALNTPYNPEAKHLWLFIQQHLFDISLPDDTFIIPVALLKGALA